MSDTVPVVEEWKPTLRVTNDELFTVRDAMRGLNRIVDRVEAGELDKAVLMRGTRMVAVIVPIADATQVERFMKEQE